MKELRTPALLLRSVPYGESDLIVTLFTEAEGKVSAIVRGGRKSSKRVGGALEPFHGIDVTLADKGTELMTMKEARLAKLRTGVTATLDRLDAAGTALRWLRHLCPPRIREPAAWQTANALLDALDSGTDQDPRIELAVASLALLSDVGYALELEQCVSCGKPCPPGRAAAVAAFRGGILCQECGGAPTRVSGELRAIAIEAQRGGRPTMSLDQARDLLVIVEGAMAAHTGLEPR